MSRAAAGNRQVVARAEWTYELPPGTGDSVWLEEYLVYDRDGRPAGKVFAVLELHGRRWLGIDRDHLPVRHDRRVVPYDAVAEIDHENLAVHLSLGLPKLEEALELDPAKGIEEGGEASRITRIPPAELPPARDAGGPGPVDRDLSLAAPVTALFGVLALLGVVVFWGASRSTAALPYFAVPFVVLLAAGILAYRAWSRPWARNAAARRHRPPPRHPRR